MIVPAIQPRASSSFDESSSDDPPFVDEAPPFVDEAPAFVDGDFVVAPGVPNFVGLPSVVPSRRSSEGSPRCSIQTATKIATAVRIRVELSLRDEDIGSVVIIAPHARERLCQSTREAHRCIKSGWTGITDRSVLDSRS
jgi:hypothetical protein